MTWPGKLGLLLTVLLLGGCALLSPQPPGIGKPVEWDNLPGWSKDSHAEAWPALLNSCKALADKPHWQTICSKVSAIPEPDNSQARAFFEQMFVAHSVGGKNPGHQGLITGYYEPLLHGSETPSQRYRYPLYQRPDSLLIVDLGDRFPQLKSQRLRGRLVGNRVIPYFTRADIENDHGLLEGNELLWLDSQTDLFFLHIQGSGRVRLDDGRMVGVGYSDQNGQPYRAIGKILVERGELAMEDVTLFSIKNWLRENPDQAGEIMNANPSYVFFVLRDKAGDGPVGSMNVPLTAERSIAIDPELVSLGVPVWLASHYPGEPENAMQKLVFAQDTGGAIKGNLRADFFWGHGREAEQAAGTMKSPGQLWVLLPRTMVPD